MVVVPGAVRICVDLKPLNESVLREPHPIAQTDDVLAQLAGASHFSKLDANSRFWQIPLAEEPRCPSNLHHTLLAVPLQQTPTLSTANEQDPGGPRKLNLPHG